MEEHTSFMTHDVGAIGRWSFIHEVFCFLGTGIMLDIFHTAGTTHSCNGALKSDLNHVSFD